MSRRSGAWLLVAALAVSGAGGAVLAATDAPGTYALFSDHVETRARVGAGSWTPPAPVVPAACGDVADYPGGVVVGTDGPDTLRAGNRGQVVLGLDGDDVLVGGNAKDCLVGGAGDDDPLGGSGADVLDGGDGDDTLDGGNGPDFLVGGSGTDVCSSGHAPGSVSGCEQGPSPAPRPGTVPAPPADEPEEPEEPPASPTTAPTGTAGPEVTG